MCDNGVALPGSRDIVGLTGQYLQRIKGQAKLTEDASFSEDFYVLYGSKCDDCGA